MFRRHRQTRFPVSASGKAAVYVLKPLTDDTRSTSHARSRRENSHTTQPYMLPDTFAKCCTSLACLCDSSCFPCQSEIKARSMSVCHRAVAETVHVTVWLCECWGYFKKKMLFFIERNVNLGSKRRPPNPPLSKTWIPLIDSRWCVCLRAKHLH